MVFKLCLASIECLVLMFIYGCCSATIKQVFDLA